jgi:hypothetical protein
MARKFGFDGLNTAALNAQSCTAFVIVNVSEPPKIIADMYPNEAVEALEKPPFVVVKTGMPVAMPLFVTVMEIPLVAATSPPTAAQELATTPLRINERDEAPAPVALAEPDGGVPTVVSTPLRMYATKAPEDEDPAPAPDWPDNFPEVLKPDPDVGL